MKQNNIFVGAFSFTSIYNVLGKENAAKLWDEIEAFDSIKEYPYNPEGKEMTKHKRALLIGKMNRLAQNLVDTGCSDLDTWVRVSKHLIVLINSLKYRLDYEQSYIDNRIYEFKNMMK